MMTFRPNDFALRVKSGQAWLTAPERVHVLAILKDGRIRARRYNGELVTCRLSELEHVRDLTQRGVPNAKPQRSWEQMQRAAERWEGDE